MIRGPILFITGAGASVDSGLRTYRGNGGVYEDGGNPESDLSISTWDENPEKTWNTLKPLVASVRKVDPGPTYELLEKICKMYKCSIFTQNVDGFSKGVCDSVWEMHGNLESMTCEWCHRTMSLDHENPKCGKCGRLCKPNIVFYGEAIRQNTTRRSHKHFKTVVVIGTTMQFMYLEDMVKEAKGKGATVIHINPGPTYTVGYGEILLRMSSKNGLKFLFNL